MTPEPQPPGGRERRLGRTSALLIALAAVVSQAWMLTLPFQLDDFLLVGDPLALFGHVEEYAREDIPPFMCRIPMWLAWAFVHVFAPEPLSPLPFHVFGLFLHTLAALLLARAVARHAPEAYAGPAALVAGAGFAIAAGAMQAVSWTAAWSSLLYTLFGLAGVNLALDARRRGSWGGLAAAAFAFYLAIITKAPAVAVPAAGFTVLAGVAFASRAWRRLAVEGAAIAAGVAAGLVTRTLFLGTQHLRYEERVTPSWTELPSIVVDGFIAFGQALFPWNRDPLFTGEEPRLAALGLDAPAVAALFCLPLLAAAFLFAPRARAALALLLLALVPSILPPGVLNEGHTTNVLSRTAYLPMATALGALGLAFGALYHDRRRVGIAGVALLAALLVDGNRHVAFTERMHGEELREFQRLFAEIADQARPGRVPLVLGILPDGGFGGIPSMGPMMQASQGPPFTAEQRVEILSFRSSRELRDWLSGASIGDRDVCVVGVESDAGWNPLPPDPTLPGSANRRRRMPRALSPLRAGFAGDEGLGTPLVADASGWTADPPLPAHAVGAFELQLKSGAPIRGALVFAHEQGEIEVRLDDPGSPGTRLACGAPLSLPLRFGNPIAHVTWRGEGPPPSKLARPLAALPELELRTPPAEATFVTTEVHDRGPRFAANGLTGAWRRGSFARLELLFEFKGVEASIFADLPVPPAGELALEPTLIHLEGNRPTPADASIVAPWSLLLDQRIVPPLSEGELNSATFRWRLTAHHPGGAPAARSIFRVGRFVLPGEE
ncbi:MAG: hypothetical protein AAF682_31515 [Planctomycetota bacterium]